MKLANSAGEDEEFWGAGEQCLLVSVNGPPPGSDTAEWLMPERLQRWLGSHECLTALAGDRCSIPRPRLDSSQPTVTLCSVVPGNLGIWNLWPWGCTRKQTPTLRHIIKLIKKKPSWTVHDSWRGCTQLPSCYAFPTVMSRSPSNCKPR